MFYVCFYDRFGSEMKIESDFKGYIKGSSKERPIFIMKVFCNNFNKTFSSKVQENVTTALYTLNYDFCLDT